MRGASQWVGKTFRCLTDPQPPQLGVPVGISCVRLQSEAKAFSRMLLRGLCKLGTTDELQRIIKEVQSFLRGTRKTQAVKGMKP